MTRARKVCAHPHCPNLMPCHEPGHAKVAWEGSTRSAELPPDWRRRRQRILNRDPICTLGVVCGGLALSTQCHHTGASNEHADEHLAGVCAACHAVVTAQQATLARRATFG